MGFPVVAYIYDRDGQTSDNGVNDSMGFAVNDQNWSRSGVHVYAQSDQHQYISNGIPCLYTDAPCSHDRCPKSCS